MPDDVRLAVGDQVMALASEDWKFRKGFPTMFGSLANMKRNGFTPQAILDIGAYGGEWTKEAAQLFPVAQLLMFEAQLSKAKQLQEIALRIGEGRAIVQNVLLGAENRDSVKFYAMETGSSVFEENTTFGRAPIFLSMCTLDSRLPAQGLPAPVLMKLDVQGYELEVLKGGELALSFSEVVIMEVSLLEYNKGAPLIGDVIKYMGLRGFVVYDICGQLRRETDGAMFQADLVFTKTDSKLRADRKFWAREV